MIHDKRKYKIIEIEDDGVGALADKLANYSWCLCTGFRWKSLLILNDAFSEDGAQEYAVIRGTEQIDSLTISWMTAERIAAALIRCETTEQQVLATVEARQHEAGVCRFCA